MSYQAPGISKDQFDLNMTSLSPSTYINGWNEDSNASSNTGITPFLFGIDNAQQDLSLSGEPNPFESSFSPSKGPTANTLASGVPKRGLSPGAQMMTQQADGKQTKRPQLGDLGRFDSSITQSSRTSSSGNVPNAQSTESDSPPSDNGYRGGESDSDPSMSRTSTSYAPTSLLPHAPDSTRPSYSNASSFDLGSDNNNATLSSQNFQSMMQSYAANANMVQNAPKAMDVPAHMRPGRKNSSPLALAPEAVNTSLTADNNAASPTSSASAQNVRFAGVQPVSKKQLPSRTTKKGKTHEPVQEEQHQQQTASSVAKLESSSMLASQSQQSMSSAGAPSGADMDNEKIDPEEDKRRQFLERNRIAACKSRQKKKEWVKQLETSADELNTANGELQKVIHCQQEEITYLRSLLSTHDGCDCNDVTHVKSKLAGVSAPTPKQVGYGASSASTNSHSVAASASPSTHSASANTPSSGPASYPSPGTMAAPGASSHQPNTLSQPLQNAMQQFTTEEPSDAFASTEGAAVGAAGGAFDYFAGSYQSAPFATPDLATELGYSAAAL